MAELISIKELRRSVIGVNLIHQKLLIHSRKKTSAKTLANRIADIQNLHREDSQVAISKEPDFIDYLETAHDLLLSLPAGAKGDSFWECADFQTGLNSVLWDVALVNFSRRSIQYHQLLAEKLVAYQAAAQDLLDEMEQFPDLEKQFHWMLRPAILPVLDLVQKIQTINLNAPEGRVGRDREARAAFLLAEMFLVKDCGMTKEKAYIVASILLWYTGVLEDEDLDDADDSPLHKVADRLRRRVRRLTSD